MIDTIKLTARHEYYGKEMLQEIADSLPMPLRYKEQSNGQPSYIGKLPMQHKPMSITIANGIICVIGSLCKAAYGNNFDTLQHQQIIATLHHIADTCGIPLREWIVNRMDVGTNMLMSKPPISYLHRFGEISRYKRLPMSIDGLLYKQERKQFAVYDKIAEAKSKRHAIPAKYIGCNILRLEARAMRGSTSVKDAYHLNTTVTAEMLCDASFYSDVIVNHYLNFLDNIHFVYDMDINIEKLTSLKEVDRMGRAAIIEKAGGITNLLQLIDRRRREGAITKKQASDLRRTFNAVVKEDADILLPSNEISELQAKMQEIPSNILNR